MDMDTRDKQSAMLKFWALEVLKSSGGEVLYLVARDGDMIIKIKHHLERIQDTDAD